MLKRLKGISSETVVKNSYWDYKIDKYKMPSGNTGEYHYVDSRGAILVVPVIGDKFVFVRQFRYLNQKESIELPGGGIKQGLSPEENALEELKEEAGLNSASLKKIGEYNPFNGVTNEICHVFAALDCSRTAAEPDESEEIEIMTLTNGEINEMISSNTIWDGMTLAAWSLYKCSKYYEG